MLRPQHSSSHIVDIYKKSSGLREAAAKLKLSHSRVHQILVEVAPELLRPPGRQVRIKPKRGR